MSELHPTLERWLVEYAQAHQHPMNRLTHKVALPLIVFHVIAMLDWIKLPVDVAGLPLSVAHLLYVVVVVFYLRLSVPLGLIMALLFALCFPLAAITPKPVVVVVAVLAWGVQLAGHAIWEKNRPAFLTNLLQALIGPVFFVAVLTGIWRPPVPASG